jgi:hypothetical protein
MSWDFSKLLNEDVVAKLSSGDPKQVMDALVNDVGLTPGTAELEDLVNEFVTNWADSAKLQEAIDLALKSSKTEPMAMYP